MKKPIYRPKGSAREYCDLAVNIYDSCPHDCSYCYARAMAKRFGKPWGGVVSAKPGIVEAVRQQLLKMRGQGKKIMLCFTCDPYPIDCDTSATREVIQAIKESGNRIQILTKGNRSARRDFDLLDENDLFGVTFSGGLYEEPGAAFETTREQNLEAAHAAGIATWVSCEPVFNPRVILGAIERISYVDHWYIGKLNHFKSGIDWRQFGHEAKTLCNSLGRNCHIKEALQKQMDRPLPNKRVGRKNIKALKASEMQNCCNL